MNHSINIIGEDQRHRAIQIIADLPLSPVYEVVIRERKKNRSAAQNSLLWLWYTEISNATGETKEEVHERYKGRFLVNIYIRDDPQYSEMIETIRAVWRQGMKEDAWRLQREIVRLTSTTTATVKQFTEYLTDIESDAWETLKIMLPRPEDLYHEAMGR